MIDTPRLVRTAAQPAAVIHLTIPRSEIRAMMGPAVDEVMQAVTSQGISPAGPTFSHHLRIDPGTFDFEVGVPVARPIAAAGRVTPAQLPAGTVVRTIYRGGYEGLGAAWGEFETWMSAHGHAAAPNLWESYVIGPESSTDPADWRTELNRPLAAGSAADAGSRS